VFLRSHNGKNFFWVAVKNDPDWSVDFWPCASWGTVHQHQQGAPPAPYTEQVNQTTPDHASLLPRQR
jgi:hypothetical protein